MSNRVLAIYGVTDEHASGITVHWMSQSGAVYLVECTDDLVQTNWLRVSVVTADSAQAFVTDTNAVDGRRFYRITEME
jgi:hypothetical protein